MFSVEDGQMYIRPNVNMAKYRMNIMDIDTKKSWQILLRKFFFNVF